MNCCAACFADRFLKEEIDRLSNELGACDFCGATNVPVIAPSQLGDRFELVCGIYEPDPNGKHLEQLLAEDWEMFAIPNASARNLLAEILDDGERVRELVSPSSRCATDRLAVWEGLRNELRTKNRYFPEAEFNRDRVASLLESLRMADADVQRTWFRARLQDDDAQIPGEKMGAPPAHLTTAGRANPVGIPYLYVGSTVETAITEVRPHPGETATVAEFDLNDDLQIIDLRSPRKMVTPFLLEDTDQVASMRGDIDFLERLGFELKTPVRRNAMSVDYIPSQFLCEFIKRAGYDGVLYASSVSDGVNLALFDPSKATIGKLSQIHIDRVTVGFRP